MGKFPSGHDQKSPVTGTRTYATSAAAPANWAL
jgi:hypothetical protein